MSECLACRKQAHDDMSLCQRCLAATKRCLAEIPGLHSSLASDTWLKMPERSDLERPHRVASSGAPANLHVLSLLDARTDVRSVLKSWIEDVHERLGFRGNPPVDTPGLCARLDVLLPWCASRHPFVGEMVQEIRREHGSLLHLVEGTRKPPKPVRCPVYLPDSGPCTGALHLAHDGTVTCSDCKSTWQFDEWRRLGSLLAQ